MTHANPSHAWATKNISSDVPPGKRELALQIQQLCRHLTGESDTKKGILEPTQAQAAKRLGISETSLSRFLSGNSVPALELLERIHVSACTDANGGPPASITLADLGELRERANADHCDSCVNLRAELEKLRAQMGARVADAHTGGVAESMTQQRALVEQLSHRLQAVEAERDHLEAQRDHLKQRCDRSKTERDRLREENARLSILVTESARHAGLESGPAVTATSEPSPLPVPRQQGDRQRSIADERAARNIAIKADALQASGRQGSTVSLMHHAVRTLSHAEVAALLCLLRHQQESELADNLIHIYGRDQSHQDVVRVALELHERGAPDDAGALLSVRAAM
ncbi:helix-turn-helix domain-containing protein [Streptomyces sp. NPDC001544]|uniref:helix-turn-helix domain-containing protein n=1 Tax=Streptomyces sp. NPDC001544 TaxID=3364584 RepID=UPI003698ED00